ncbi:Transcription Cofactor Vestigial-Like Protein 1 [Manis pentadactyla]|nr:Transcription Cofactor Vestigial-Like Protein 1 [Manis pentadactyla]
MMAPLSILRCLSLWSGIKLSPVSLTMEEMRKTAVQMQRPIKTEWNSRCVLFTYFQGDIGSVVDEHFSRALSNVRIPQGLSPMSQSEDVTLRNDGDMPPNEWHFSSQWTKPQPEGSFSYGASNCSFSGPGPATVDPYSLPVTESPRGQPGELWHLSSLASPSFPDPGCSQGFSTGPLVAEPQADVKHEPFLSLLQQDQCLTHPQESAMWEDYNSTQTAGNTGLLFSLPSSTAHYKKIYFPPDHGPASASPASEDSQSPERRTDMFFY